MVWEQIWNLDKTMDIHQVTSKCIELILEQSMRKGSADNVTAVMICFQSLFWKVETSVVSLDKIKKLDKVDEEESTSEI